MFEKEIYQQRRSHLCELVGSGIILLPGNSDSSINYPDNIYHFRQDSHFIYFIGIDQPDLFILIDIDAQKTILFGEELTMDDIIWTGPMESLSNQAEKSGITQVMPSSALSGFINKAQTENREIHFLPPFRAKNMLKLASLLGIPAQQLKEAASEKLIRVVVALRSIKGSEEIAELNKAAAIGYAMHYAAMTGAVPGAFERDLAGLIDGIALSKGYGVSFPTILSQKGEVLHGHDHSQVLEKGRLMLCDAGAESLSHYASDFTRTTPVGGHFTSQKKDLYQIVLDANNKAFELIRPGVFYKDVHLDCCRVMAEGLKSLGILKGNMDEAVAQGVHALFMVHGLGHMMGLDVHDMEDLGEDYVGYDAEMSRSSQFGLSSLRLGRRLQPGFVMTVEPGLYFIPALIQKWESQKHLAEYIDYSKAKEYIGIGGIRLEDDVLVTVSGCRIIGEKRLPITPVEIEGLF
ncbi:MAG: aminopeptidase P family protein [Bacteroidales bacterium]|nr:aminopeptidase P family protein [Bacteroidales bacterium]